MSRNRSGSVRSMHIVRGPGDHSPRAGAATPSEPATPPSELILMGRRYRLVPVDEAEEQAPTASVSGTDILTAQEFQIVTLVSHGRVNKQIADDLRISEWTVSTHLRRIFAKLGVDTRAAMVSACLGNIPTRSQPRSPAPRR